MRPTCGRLTIEFFRQVDERAATLAVTVQQSRLSGDGVEPQLKPKGGKQFGELRKAHFAGASVFQRIQRSATG
jgi:hypothetical protein